MGSQDSLHRWGQFPELFAVTCWLHVIYLKDVFKKVICCLKSLPGVFEVRLA